MKKLSSVFVAVALLAGTASAAADPWHGQDRGHDRYDHRDNARGRGDHRGGWHERDQRGDWNHRYYSDRGYGYGGPRHWQRGYRYDGPMMIVNDYRAYRLAPPPYGYRWVRNDGNYLLVSIGDSMILDMVIR